MLLSVGLAFAAGIPLVTIARRIGLPPILLLTAAGVLIGPGVLGEAALVDPADLGRGLEVLVALAVGLILFEGGLTLDRGVLREAPVVITRLLTVGVFVTLLVGTLALVFLADRPWREALLGASLVVVTGPTVIGPLLKRVRLNERLHGILHWEGVVIDPIGVFVALLCFEIAMSDESGGLTAVVDLVVRVLGGSIIGIIGGRILLWLHRRDLVPADLTNVFTLSVAVGVFTVAESIRSEAGVLAATVAGYTLGFQRPERLRHLRAFKEEIVFLLIGALFILLAGRLDFERFESFGVGGLLAVLAMMFVARPLSIVLCTWGSDLGWNERTFLAWVAPRGIVAASMASLFALALERANPDDVGFVETFTWSVIMATILLQATTAGPLAGLLGLRRKHPKGWIIVGAHSLGRRIAHFATNQAKVPVLLIDQNKRAIREAKAEGLHAIEQDARRPELAERADFARFGNLLALTDNEDLNVRLCDIWSDMLGKPNVWRWGGEESDSGSRFAQGLPRPGLISAEMERGDAKFVVDPDDHGAGVYRVASVNDDVMDLARPENTSQMGLHLIREADYFRQAFLPEGFGPLRSNGIEDILHELMDRLVAARPDINREQILADLLSREQLNPTFVGDGVCIPHTHARGLDERVCVLGIAPEGTSYGPHHVRLVFLLISPTGDPESHLATLAEIGRTCLDPSIRQALMDASSGTEALRVVEGAHA